MLNAVLSMICVSRRRRRRGDRAEDAEPGRDPLRLVDDRLDDQVGGLLGRERRDVLVHLRRRDHRRAHQRHVDRVKLIAVVDELRRPRSARTRRAPTSTRRRPRSAARCDSTPIELMLMMWPRLLLEHPRQEAHDQPQRAEVVELHRPLEVVEAVERVDHAAADRAPRVVDQDVARRRAPSSTCCDQRVAGRRGRRRRRCTMQQRPPAASISCLVSTSFSAPRATRITLAPALGELDRRRLADARRGAGDDDDLVLDRARQRCGR